jgi:hypothetical protein
MVIYLNRFEKQANNNSGRGSQEPQPSAAIIFLISAMALPGLRPLGQVLVQSYKK